MSTPSPSGLDAELRQSITDPPSTLGQARLAAHSDFGSFTLVFQDSVGGLEIQDPVSDTPSMVPQKLPSHLKAN